MKKIRKLPRKIQWILAEILAYRLNSIKEALHYHHSFSGTAQHYEAS